MNLETTFDVGVVPRFPVFNFKDSDWKDGIVVRSPNWLGDAIMTFPALVQLKKLLPPGKKLSVVCPPGLAGLYKTMPLVDNVFALSKAHSSWAKGEVKALRELNAGVGLLFSNSPRDAVYFRLAKISKLFGAAARGRSILLKRSYKYPKRVNGLNHFQHSAKYLSMVYALGCEDWSGDLPDFRLEKDTISPDVQTVLNSAKVLAVAGGAAYGPAKRWSSENYNQVAAHWIEQGGIVVTLGTKAERPIADEIVKDLPAEKVFNLTGETDLIELMMILRNVDECIANDSGTMHLSAGLGGKGVAIYGSTDPTATAPISTDWHILFEQLDCAPCFSRECPLGTYACLKKITPEMVIELLENRQL